MNGQLPTDTLPPRLSSGDEARGIDWWNRLTPARREHWLHQAKAKMTTDPNAADAYRAYLVAHETGQHVPA